MNIITKDKMKTGQIATLKSGEIGMVFKQDNDTVCVVTCDGYYNMYDKFMCNESSSYYDVLEVYDSNIYYWNNLLKHKIDFVINSDLNKLDVVPVNTKPALTLAQLKEIVGFEFDFIDLE